MNNLTFFLDDYPQNLLNFREIVDFNAKIIAGFMYSPIFLIENGRTVFNGIVDESINGELRLKFGNSRWSDGSEITAKDFYNSLRYLIEESPLSNYLNFIKGVAEYSKEEITFDEIKMKALGDYFYAEVYRNDLYKGVFSNVNFSPKKIVNGRPDNNVTSGGYKLLNQGRGTIILARNQNLSNLPEYIFFRIEKDFSKQMERVKSENNSYTGFTSTIFSQVGEHKIFPIYSEIHFRLIVSPELLNVLNLSEFRYKIIESISNNTELEKLIETSEDNPKDVFKERKQTVKSEMPVNFLYPNYYPNDKLAKLTSAILSEYGYDVRKIPVKLSDFINKDYQDYEVVLELVESVSSNKVDGWIEQIRYIEKSKRSEYVRLINEYLEFDVPKENIAGKIEEVIFSSSRCIDMGVFKQYYIKSENAPELLLTDDGLVKIKAMSEKEYDVEG